MVGRGNDLKACPFCGGDDLVVYGFDIGCGRCGVGRHTVATWQSRPIEDAQAATIADVRAECNHWIAHNKSDSGLMEALAKTILEHLK